MAVTSPTGFCPIDPADPSAGFTPFGIEVNTMGGSRANSPEIQ